MDWGFIFEQALQSGLGPDAVVYALAAIGLNVHFGYTGLLNFGQAGFMAVGAYGLAASVASWGLSFWVGLLVGLGAAVVLALLLGAPTLRLRADYLAIVTIAAAEILRIVIGSVSLKDEFGGRDGLQAFSDSFFSLNPYNSEVDLGLFALSSGDAWVTTVGWILVALCCLLVWALMRSPWGRVLKSIREDEDAVRSLGKNVFAFKMQALVLGGLFGALAGFMVALQQSAINPDNFSTDVTFFAYAVLILGGAARVLGPVIGAIIFWFLISGLGTFFSEAAGGKNPLIPTWLMNDTQASLIRFILLGVGLALLMILRPQGMFGDRRELALDGR
jgi:branched-chain amino acid transport system permease protein